MDIIKPSEKTLSAVTLAKVCRTCLCEGEMCNTSEIYIAGKNSSELLSLYASVQVELNDDLPQRMCLNCIDELIRVDLFVTKCKESDRTLRNIKTEVKTEADDLCDVGPEFMVCEQPNTLRDFKTDPENCCDIGVELVDEQLSTLGDIKTEPEDGCIVGLEFVACDQLNTNVPSENTCSFCSETFGSSVELRSHRLETKHFKVYKCDFCEERCSTNSAMLKHMRVHLEENPNASETCGKDMKTEVTLTRLEIFNLTRDIRGKQIKIQTKTVQSAISKKIGAQFQMIKDDVPRLTNILSKIKSKWASKGRKLLPFLKANENWLNVKETFKDLAHPGLNITNCTEEIPFSCNYCKRKF